MNVPDVYSPGRFAAKERRYLAPCFYLPALT